MVRLRLAGGTVIRDHEGDELHTAFSLGKAVVNAVGRNAEA